MKTISNDKIDYIVVAASITYICLPIAVFCAGWLKLPIAIVGCFAMIMFGYRLFKHIEIVFEPVLTKKYWMILIIAVVLWVFLSGIGGFCFQNSDFHVRNAVFRDLCNYSWPVYYDNSLNSKIAQQYVGQDTVGFAYYFSWWLPVCAVVKIFHLNEYMANVLLYVWAVIGLVLMLYHINRFLKKQTYLTIFVMAFFSGMDVVIWIVSNGMFPITEHLEWWASYFQYSSNTTQLFWVFNQSIPIWLLISILLQLKNNRFVLGLCALSFAYSPWATFGMIPIACSTLLGRNKEYQSAVNIDNILIPIFMLVIYGSFYTAGGGNLESVGNIFFMNPGWEFDVLGTYLWFILLEFGIYYLCMGKQIIKYPFYYVVLLELLLIPLYKMSNGNDFAMRASIPALFLTTVYVIKFLKEDTITLVRRKAVLAFFLVIGTITPITEITRSVVYTQSNDRKADVIYSFGNINPEGSYWIEVVKKQFFVYDYQNTIFFKYMSK